MLRSCGSDWYFKFKPEGPWSSDKCDAANKTLCSDLFHEQEQSPGFPHGDGDCTAPACDCGSVPCGFYIWVSGQSILSIACEFRPILTDCL